MPLPSGLPDLAVTVRRVIYLHGFASSSQSTKAGFFAERLRSRGVTVDTPDFNLPDFATLTMTRMLAQLDRAVGGGDPVALMGSSLGGALAILAASRFGARVERLVLMAPAVMFSKPGHQLLPPERIDEWRRAGALPFFHYGYNEPRPLGFAFHEDMLQYDAFDAAFGQPALIFQGLRDASVDPHTVEQFAHMRPNVTLSLLDDDHQLIASLPRMWEGVEEFLGLID